MADEPISVGPEPNWIVAGFGLVGAGLGAVGLLGTLLLGQFLGSIFRLVAVAVILLSGPVLAFVYGLWSGETAPLTVGWRTVAGYLLCGLLGVFILSLGGGLPVIQLGIGVIAFSLPIGVVGAGVAHLAHRAQ
ncbi:hypothetical protein [Haladaptatus sp. DJG-WS-42]|uniref:hypothetical protein n=1 Tax=Haladaptatus sp. DJG-WS-42 TaxID=3120516 RepID=UPI0030CE45CE